MRDEMRILMWVAICTCAVATDAAAQLVRYKFDEASSGSTPAMDSGPIAPAAPASFHGGATRTPNTPGGKSLGALDLTAGGEGAINYLSTDQDVDKLDALSRMTITTWINLRAAPQNDDVIVMDWPSFPAATEGGWSLSINRPFNNSALTASSFSVLFSAYRFDGSGGGQISTTLNADHRWLFLAVTFDLTGSMTYFSGTESSSVTALNTGGGPTLSIDDNSTELRIGSTSQLPAFDHTPPAWIDDLRIYNTALSPSQIEAVRLNNLPEPSAALTVSLLHRIVLRRVRRRPH